MQFVARPKIQYINNIIPFFKKKFNYKSIMQVPKLIKIVISQGLGDAVLDKKIIDYAIDELSIITGQKAVPCFSKKDEAGFKLRKGLPIGVKVTLRKNKMYEFLDRLISVALPQIRDFNGISMKSFDGKGNYNLGISEQIIFPEINIDKVKKIRGMDIAFVTSAKTDYESNLLLSQFGLPFKNIIINK